MDLMTPLAAIADASIVMNCQIAACGECAEANLAYNLISTCYDVVAEELGHDDPKLLAMCATAKHAKECMLKARANTAEIERLLASESCDLDEIHRLRGEYNALHFNAGNFCPEARHQVIFDQTVNLLPGPFEKRVIEAVAKQGNVFCVAGAHGQSFVATDSTDSMAGGSGAFGSGVGAVGLVPGTFDPKTAATFADFDPLGTALYANGPEATAKLYADASAVADSPEFKVLSLRAAAARNSVQYSQEANSKALRVWRAILAFVEEDPQERASRVDVTVLLQDLAYKTTAATVLHTMCRPSLRLLTTISTSVQKGDLTAFATNYAAAAQKMAQGLAPGQRAYFTIAKSVESVSGAEAAEAPESRKRRACTAPESDEAKRHKKGSEPREPRELSLDGALEKLDDGTTTQLPYQPQCTASVASTLVAMRRFQIYDKEPILALLNTARVTATGASAATSAAMSAYTDRARAFMEAVAPGIHVELLMEVLALVSHVHATDLGLDDSELGLLGELGGLGGLVESTEDLAVAYKEGYVQSALAHMTRDGNMTKVTAEYIEAAILSRLSGPSGPSDASGAELEAEELIIHEELDEEGNTLPDLYWRRLSSKLAKQQALEAMSNGTEIPEPEVVVIPDDDDEGTLGA